MEYGAERKISRHSVLSATVSIGVPQGVTLKIKYWPNPNYDLILQWVLISLRHYLMCVCICAGVCLQVGTCQSNVPVSSPPNRSASTQCGLLCHRGTPSGLHGRPQTDYHPIYASTERAVSTCSVLVTSHFNLTLN